jgi:DNA-binding NarL/FixJ family response regulator
MCMMAILIFISRVSRCKTYDLKAVETQSRKLRILLADDHPVILESLERLFHAEPDLVVVGKAVDGQSAIELARSLQPDVALIDERMPLLNGLEATKQIIAAWPQIRVIGFSANEDPLWVTRMRAAGAVQCLTKGGSPEELLAAVRAHRKE